MQFPRTSQTCRQPLANRQVARPARLDKGTKLVVRESAAGWSVSAFPDCAEAVISFAPSYQAPEDGGRGSYGDAEANRLRAERRAVKQVRRFAVANGIDRLVSLTFGPPRCTDPKELRQHMARSLTFGPPRCTDPKELRLELTRFGGHLTSWEDVHDAEGKAAVSA